jgi:hypothetical protein
MSTLPTWAVYVVALGTPLASFVAVLIGHLLLRKGANELDVWRRREETMRMLRWASEHAVSTEDATARMGLAVLDALSESELLQLPDQALVDAVLDSVLEEALEEIEHVGSGAEVIEVDTGSEDWDSDEH